MILQGIEVLRGLLGRGVGCPRDMNANVLTGGRKSRRVVRGDL